MTHTTPTTLTQSRLVGGILFLLALAFGLTGASKLAGVPQMVAFFDGIGIGQWFLDATGGIAVAGASLLLLPVAGLLGGIRERAQPMHAQEQS